MPRDITHVILADETAERLNNKDISDNPEAFHMGCLADDSFLFTLSPHLSTRLHGYEHDTRLIVLEMIHNLKNETDPKKASEKRAFIYGYVCHMAADLTFHPLIYSISGSHFKNSAPSKRDIELSKSCHRYAETWLDLQLMKDKKLSFHDFKPFRKIMRKMGMRVRLDDFFTDCCQNVLKAKKYTWGDNFDLQAQFHNGMTRQFLVDEITQSQTIAKMMRKMDIFSHGKLKLYTSGFYNFSRDIPQRLTSGSFIHPVTGETINKSIADLEEDTIQCSVKFIHAVDDYIKTGDKEAFLRDVPNINLDTGTEDMQPIKKKPNEEDYFSMMGESKDAPIHKKDPFNLFEIFKKSRKNSRN